MFHAVWSANKLEAMVWDALVNVLRDPEQLFTRVKKHKGQLDAERVDASALLTEAERALTAVQKKRGRLLDLFLSESIDKATFETRDVPLKKEEARLTEERDQAKALVSAGAAESSRRTSVLKQCALILEGLDRLDDERKQQVIRGLVNWILVSDEGVEIHGILGEEILSGNRSQSHPIVLAAAYPAASRSSRGAAKRASSSRVATTGMAGQSWGRGAPPRKRTTGRS